MSTLQWSCDEKDRTNCRNAHGCHCREITDLVDTVRGKEAIVTETLRLLRRRERDFDFPIVSDHVSR